MFSANPHDMNKLFHEARRIKKAHIHLERLGFRGYTKDPGKPGPVVLTLNHLRDFWEKLLEVTKDCFRRMTSIEAVQEALSKTSSPIHERVRRLLDECGPEIWNQHFASRSLDDTDVHYPRHLLYENLHDRSLIQRAIYGWIIVKACRLVKLNRSSSSLQQTDDEEDEITLSDTMHTPVRSSRTSRKAQISVLPDTDDDPEQGNSGVDRLSTDDILDKILSEGGSALRTSISGNQYTTSTYRADVAPMYPAKVATASGSSSSLHKRREDPQPAQRAPQLARRTPQHGQKTHKRNRSALAEDEDSNTSLDDQPTRKMKTTSARSPDSVVDVSPLVQHTKEPNQIENCNRTFNSIRSNVERGGIIRWGCLNGQSTFSRSVQGTPTVPEIVARSEDTPLTPSSLDSGHRIKPIRNPPIGAVSEHEIPFNVLPETTIAGRVADSTTAVAGKVANHVLDTPHAVAGPIAQGKFASLIVVLKLKKQGPSSRPQGTNHIVARTSASLPNSADLPRNANPFPATTTPSEDPAPGSQINENQHRSFLRAEEHRKRMRLADKLFEVLLNCSPEKHDLGVIEDAIGLVEALSKAKGQDSGETNEQHQTALEDWLICVNALVKFRKVTKFAGNKSERTAMIKGLKGREKFEAYHLLATPAAKLAVDLTEFSRILAQVLLPMAVWPSGLNLEEMAELISMFNNQLVIWYAKDEAS
ncbi:hypothetical protein NX059_007826 [Plenodomus lindquistii]|nr:hypothetical protein NX059_007826 [Plenodomus lindquistii]